MFSRLLGLETVGYHLFGHPGETKRELNDTLRMKAFVCLYLKNQRFLDLARFIWSVRGAAFKKSRHLARRILGRGRYGGRGGPEDVGATSYTKGGP